MTSEQMPRGVGPHRSRVCNREQQSDIRDRQALRQLIDRFCDHPQIDNDNGFYRNVGRYIARSMTKPRWPGDSGY
jgi:hypothetical protein